MKSAVTAFELYGSLDCLESISEAVAGNLWHSKQSKYSIFVWSEENSWSDQTLGPAANGYEIGRLGKSAFGDRFYIMPRTEPIGNSTELWTSEECRLLSDKGIRMGRFSVPLRLAKADELLDRLDTVFGGSFRRLDESVSFKSVEKEKRIHLGQSGFTLRRPERLWMPFRTRGPLQAPGLSLLSVYSEQFEGDRLEQLAVRLRASIAKLAPDVEVRVADFCEVNSNLSSICSKGRRSVAYVGVRGGHGEPISPRTREHLERLDLARIPYRAFGDKTFTERYALNDQVPHLIELLGGHSFRTVPVSGFEKTTYLGFDLGHPKSKRHSVPVMTVVDARGRLLGYWRGQQPRDETIRSGSIRAALEWLRRIHKKLSLSNDWVVLRDGKSFKNDGMCELFKELGEMTTYVEVIKNPVPLMHRDSNPMEPGGLAILDDGREVLLQTEQPLVPYQIGRPIRLRLGHNPAGRSIESVAASVFSLCHAPSLGLRSTRSPGPIYWADGLAKESGKALQFAGLHHVEHN